MKQRVSKSKVPTQMPRKCEPKVGAISKSVVAEMKCRFHPNCDQKCESLYDAYDKWLLVTAEGEGMIDRSL